MAERQDIRARASERVADATAAASERVADAKATASERVAGARATASERAADAKTAASERVADARAAAEEFIARQKPRLRGVSHEWAFFVSLVAGGALVIAAPTSRATLAVAIYAASLSALLGVSALYHRVNWRRPSARRWMRRLDHSMIFVLIAGTVTPFAVLVMQGPWAEALLIAVWAGAAAGIVVEAGIGAGALIAAGGVLYTAGALVYARQRPDPRPAVFGYHEIFHALVIAAAAAHFAAIALFALPG